MVLAMVLAGVASVTPGRSLLDAFLTEGVPKARQTRLARRLSLHFEDRDQGC